MTAPGTPGPWSVAGDEVYAACGSSVCIVLGSNDGPQNANLIAAAPCMYEALVYARESLGSPVPISRWAVARRIDAALAKARGETA